MDVLSLLATAINEEMSFVSAVVNREGIPYYFLSSNSTKQQKKAQSLDLTFQRKCGATSAKKIHIPLDDILTAVRKINSHRTDKININADSISNEDVISIIYEATYGLIQLQ